MGQTPVVFLRQVLGLVVNTEGQNDPSIPSDAKERAQTILSGCKVTDKFGFFDIVIVLIWPSGKFNV